MTVAVHTHECKVCNKKMTGRIDKKFCSSICRDYYHNELKIIRRNQTKHIIHILQHNFSILQTIQPIPIQMNAVVLLQQGFNFTYCTHWITLPDGQIYLGCFDYAWRFTSQQEVHIIHANQS